MPPVDRDALEERIGRVVSGKWTLERLIGAGGMAAVYAAKHEIGRREAIKILHPEVARDADLVARFKREAHAVNRFSHPGAVEIRDIDVTDDGEPFLVMELLEGESLARKLKKGNVTTEEGLRLIDELLDVLIAAHAEGVIHRDIKPSNLFIEPDGHLKVLDFGVARLKHAPGTLITDVGTTLGTVAYMPPEQLRGDDIDHRADIYAAGATLFRIVSGEKVHLGEEDEVAQKVLKGPARTLVDAAPDAGEGVQRVVDRALAHLAERRYPDAETMQKDVRAVIEGKDPPYATGRLDDGDSPRDREPLPVAGQPVRVTEIADDDQPADRDTDLDTDGLTKKTALAKVAKTIVDDSSEDDEDETTKKRTDEPEIDLEAPTRVQKPALDKPGKTEIADDDDLPTKVKKKGSAPAPKRRAMADDAPRSLSNVEPESSGKGLMWAVVIILVGVVAMYTLRDRDDPTPRENTGRTDKPVVPTDTPSAPPSESAPEPLPSASTAPEPSASAAPSAAPSAEPNTPDPAGSTPAPIPPSRPPLLPSSLPTALPSGWPGSLPSSLPWPPALPSALRPPQPPAPTPQPPAPQPPAPQPQPPAPQPPQDSPYPD